MELFAVADAMRRQPDLKVRLVFKIVSGFDIRPGAKVLGKALVVTAHNWRRAWGSLGQRLWKRGYDSADSRTHNVHFVIHTWQAARTLPRSPVVPAVTHFGGRRVASESRRGFFFIGRLIEGKGIAELIEAYAMPNLDLAVQPLSVYAEIYAEVMRIRQAKCR